MNPFFDWLIKSSVSLALLYLAFKLAVSRDKIFMINRFVLLGILFISAILPLMDIPVFQETVVIPKIDVLREFIETQEITNASFTPEIVSTVQKPESIQLNRWMVFYLLVILTLSIRLLVSVFRVLQIIRRAEKQPFQKIILAIVKDFIQPFSFLQHIVISEKDFTENKDIVIAHEYAHIKNLHAIDLLICELFTALHWFNPFMWLLRRDLKLIHEYQADQAVLNKGIDAKKYQLLVVEKAVGERRFAMANHFTQKPILKRIKMMHRKNENYWKGVKLILFAPVVLLLLQAFARPEILVEKAKDIVPTIQVDETKEWLGKWTIENIGNENLEPAIINDDVPRKEKNVLVILINRNDDFLIEGEFKTKDDVKEIVKNFLNGMNAEEKYNPDYTERDIPFLGKKKVSNGAVSVRHDMETSDELINLTLKNIGEVYLEARKEKAENLFAEDYFELDSEKQKAIDLFVPIQFSYLSPKITGTSQQKPPPPPPPIDLKVDKKGEIYIGDHIYPTSGNVKQLTVYKTKLSKENLVSLLNKRSSDFESESKKYNVNYKNLINLVFEEGTERSVIESIISLIRENKNTVVNVTVEDTNINNKSSSSIQPEPIKPPPPPPPAKIELTLRKDGKVLFSKEEYSVSEVEQIMIELQKEQVEIYKMYNVEPEMITSVQIEVGVTDQQVLLLKEALKRAKVLHVNYSTDFKESEWKEQSSSERTNEVKPPPPPPPSMFWVGLSNHKIFLSNKEISLTELEQKAKSFIEREKESYYVRVTADSGVSPKEFETVTDVLKKLNIPESKILCIVDDDPNN